MPQTQPSTKPINNNLSIAFANDNFYGINHPPLEGGSNGNAVWGGVNFLNASQAFNQNPSPQETSLNNPHSASNPSPAFNNFKSSPNSTLNASLFLPDASPMASLWQKQFALGFASFASLPPEPVLAKNAVRVFLTPELTSATLKSEHWEEHKSSSINPVAVAQDIAKKVVKAANKAVNKVQKLATKAAGATGIDPLEKLVASQNKIIDKEQDYAKEHITDPATGANDPKGSALISKTESKSSSSTITEASSNIIVGGDLMLNSTQDATIKASNLNINGNALINTGGDLLITSAAQTTNSSQKDRDIQIGELTSNVNLSHASASAGIKGTGTGYEEQQQAATQKSSNINIGGSLLANAAGDTTIVASNVNVAGDAIIKTGGDFNLKDAADTTSLTSKESTIEVEVGAKVGNAYVDAGYAWKAVIDAQLKVVEAIKKLAKMEKLREQGKASSKAVAFATLQLTLAQAGVVSATIAAASATAGAAAAASSSFGTGMYAAAYMNATESGIKNTNTTLISKASNFTTGGSIDVAANNDVNVIGSMMESLNGNVALKAKDNINITAGENRITQNSKQETNNAAASVGNNGVQVSVGHSEGESDYQKTFYTNSQINSQNGTTTLTSGNDVNINGGNLLAQNMIINAGNNLNVESKQTQEDSSSSGFGFNIGLGVGAGGASASAGFNMSNSEMTRTWTDNITTLIATGAMQVNTGLNNATNTGLNAGGSGSPCLGGASLCQQTMGVHGDLNLTGAAILSDNMTLNIAGNINKTNLEDKYYSESMGLGLQVSIPLGGGSSDQKSSTPSSPTPSSNNSTDPQSPAQGSPKGSETITANYSQNEASRTVYATIGGLNSRLVSETKTMIGADFEGTLTIDNRLFSDGGRNQIADQMKYSADLAKKIGQTAATQVMSVANKAAASINNTYQELFPKSTPEQKQELTNAMVRAFINNDPAELEPLMQKYNLTEAEKNKVRDFYTGDASNRELIAGLDADTKSKLVKTVLIAIDGTGNNRYLDGAEKETNVAKGTDLYTSTDKRYITGIGTSGNILVDPFCQGIGCGVDGKQADATEFLKTVQDKNPDKIILVDLLAFSRGGPIARDYANKIYNELVPGLKVNSTFVRSELLFDSVAAFGIPGNGLNLGLDLSIPKGVIAIQATAANENRNAFALQSILDWTNNPNLIEKSFLGDHSDIGGAHPDGYQGKSNDIGKETLNWMINEANTKVGDANNLLFNQPSSNQQPSTTIVNLQNNYNVASDKLFNDLRSLNSVSAPDFYNNIANLNQAQNQANDYIHSEVNIIKPWNWNLGGRNTFYPNVQLRTGGESVSINP